MEEGNETGSSAGDAPEPAPDPAPDPLQLIAGRYKTMERLGTGAAGVVFRAIDTKADDRDVALKILAPVDFKDEKAKIRFEKEVNLTKDFKHDNLIEVYDSGLTETRQQYVAMEYVDGGTLSTHIYESDLSFEQVLFILRDVASGTGFAHSHNVVHRDLKPANIILTQERRAKVADFGLARELAGGATITHSAETVGTPFYMAPEQFRSHRVDGRADIYALGIIAYELVNKKRPFASQIYQQVAMAHLQKPVPAFHDKHSSFPKWYESFVFVCTEKNPDKRFQTMQEVVTFLERRMAEMGLIEGVVVQKSLWRRVLSKLLGH